MSALKDGSMTETNEKQDTQQELDLLRRNLDLASQEINRINRIKPLANAAAAVVHDIRNSLGVISSTAQFVLNKLSPGEKERQAWELVTRNVESIKNLLTGYLGMARQTEARRESCFLNDIVDRVSHFVDARARKQGVKVETDLARDLPELVLNIHAVETAVLNIAINAIDAMPDGGTLKFATRAEPARSEKRVMLDISDTGPGIPPEIMDKIFMPFFTTKGQGTGMGLYSAKAAVENSDGELACRSRPGETRMTLSFSALVSPRSSPDKPK
ncbi:MAG: hypothetical protein A2902_02170 [Elusimicrobia bacterium RIFCSPLOWO2_01_FULL_64_13]|nr:MAG: hypothetical protein A2902_02170 [Elusimicrobia bacterium RIFCSPLOWO2_01_FULL_64_13]